MIAKTSIGRSFKGCCDYNIEKVEKGKGEMLLSQGVRDFDRAAMVADFVRQAKMNPDLSRSVWHTSLSFAPTDEARLKQDPQLMEKVARDYLKGMGLDQSQYVVIRHSDTDHSHLHIIANRVANDGQTVSDSLNYQRQSKLMRQIEQQHDLTPTVEQPQRKSLEKVPDRDRQRIEMRDQVRGCLKQAASKEEFSQALGRQGIRLIVNRTDEGVSRGLTFSRSTLNIKGEEGETISFKGSKLHKDLGLSGIQQQLQLNAQLRQKREQEREKSHKVVEAQKPEKSPQIEEKQPKRGIGRGM